MDIVIGYVLEISERLESIESDLADLWMKSDIELAGKIINKKRNSNE